MNPDSRWHGLALIVATAVLAGCAGSKGTEAGETDLKPTVTARKKEDAKYNPANQETLASVRNLDLRLTRLVMAGKSVDLPSGAPVTLKLGDGGRIAGKGPVNRFFGAMQIAVDGSGRVTWPNAALGMTRMAGSPEAAALESKFIQALTTTSRLMVGDDGLRLENADRSTMLEFSR